MSLRPCQAHWRASAWHNDPTLLQEPRKTSVERSPPNGPAEHAGGGGMPELITPNGVINKPNIRNNKILPLTLCNFYFTLD